MRVWLAILVAVAVLLVGCNVAGTVPPTSGLRIIAEVYPPYNFVDKNNNVTGQSTEIVQAILDKTGTQANIEVMPLSQGLALAEKGPKVVVYSLNRTPQREDLFKWVGPIGNYEQAFYAKKGSAVAAMVTVFYRQLEDAKKVEKIGVYKGDAGAQFLASQGFTNLDESQTDAEALQKLMDGEVQLWLGNKDGLAITAAQAGANPADLVMMPTVVIRADLYIAFSKDIPDSTVTAWQSALDALKQEKDVDYKTVYEKIMAEYSDPEYINSLIGQ